MEKLNPPTLASIKINTRGWQAEDVRQYLQLEGTRLIPIFDTLKWVRAKVTNFPDSRPNSSTRQHSVRVLYASKMSNATPVIKTECRYRGLPCKTLPARRRHQPVHLLLANTPHEPPAQSIPEDKLGPRCHGVTPVVTVSQTKAKRVERIRDSDFVHYRE